MRRPHRMLSWFRTLTLAEAYSQRSVLSLVAGVLLHLLITCYLRRVGMCLADQRAKASGSVLAA